MANINMTLDNYEAQDGFDLLNAGWYEAEVIDSEIKEGAKGPYILWTFQIQGKPNRVWEIMSLGSEVSLQRLKSMAQCCGHKNPNFIADTDELHGLACRVRLKIEKDKTGEYEDKNRISSFKPLNGGNQPQTMNPASNEFPETSLPSQAAAAAQQQQSAEQPKMPWE